MANKNGDEGPNTLNFRSLGNSDDRGYGQGGNDRLYGGGGEDVLFGMDDDDLVYGDFGNDELHGGLGRDVLRGGIGNDELIGNAQSDWLYGDAGNDWLYGGDDRDFLFGGSGSDHLDSGGGPGQDFLTGGSGRDFFIIQRGYSFALSGQGDTINDWVFSEDHIDSNVAGSIGNYTESSGGATTILEARLQVQASGFDGVHGFIYNSNNNTGYLISDANNDGRFETGVTLKGAGSAGSMDWSDII